jgi:hypothetical protein
MVIKKSKILLINFLKKTLPLYIEEAGREKIIEFQKYINPTYLALYKQV